MAATAAAQQQVAAQQQAQERAARNQQQQQQQQAAMNEKPPPRPMDPLVRSLTRMDEATKNAPTRQIPLFGEVVLDRSLYLFVPAAIFAVLGFIMSITVIINSGDVIVNNLTTAATTSTTDTTQSSSTAITSDCRGICSSQEQDLEGLRNFMSSFGK
jgi:hypothetical protein